MYWRAPPVPVAFSPMSGIAGPFFAVAALLGAAGLAKVVRPRTTAQALRSGGLPGTLGLGRCLGAVEVAIAIGALLSGGRLAAGLVSACYLGFALFTARLLVLADSASCGCFGESEAPATPVHVALNLAAVTAAALAAGWPPGPLGSVVADQPWSGIPFLALVAMLAWLTYVAMTLVPELAPAGRPRRERPTDGATDRGAPAGGASPR